MANEIYDLFPYYTLLFVNTALSRFLGPGEKVPDLFNEMDLFS